MTTSEPPLADSPPSLPTGLDLRDIAVRVLSITGLVASTVLLVDYVRSPVFCDDRGVGCDVVRRWSATHLGTATMPSLGVVFFVVLLGLLALRSNPRARRLLDLMALSGAVLGVALMAVQAVALHALCKYCLVVDSSALGAGILTLLLNRPGNTPNAPLVTPRWVHYVTVGAATLAVGGPLGYGFTRPSPHREPFHVETHLPDAIASAQQPGTATIVEFVDYECPFCRRQQEAMAPVLASYGNRVHLVRHNVPLSTIHPHALVAARAACCADEQHRGEAMAVALFQATDLTPEGCAQIAQNVGVDMDTWRACMASQRPEVSLEQDRNLAHTLGVHGLPTFWIGNERFEGSQAPEAIRASVDRALAHPIASPRSGT